MANRVLVAASLFACTACLGSPARAQGEVPAFEDRELEALASPELQTFEGEQEFRRYLRDVDRIYRKRHPNRRYWRGSQEDAVVPDIVVAQAEVAEPVCTDPEWCPDEGTDEGADAVVVTGSRVSTPTITNVQVSGVDEGDIVKQIGDYLLVLQDGRIFAIHYPSMRLTDRIDVYRRDAYGGPAGADWYDEMLVQGDQVIITAYSYQDEASEISVFRLDQPSGRIERRGVFLITSDDYYDVDNYATRIIGDKLVIHTPFEAEQVENRSSRPVVRRWLPSETRDEAVRNGRELFEASDIYYPVFAVEEPVIHTISICPLGEVAERGLECRSTGFVGAEPAEMFVTPDNIYLWLPAISWRDFGEYECPKMEGRTRAMQVAPAAVMRLPLGSGVPTVLGMRGRPFDQFSMDEHGGRFRALTSWGRDYCENDDNVDDRLQHVALVDQPLTAFRSLYREPREGRFVALPSPGTRVIENRFVGDWLVYGGRDNYSGRPYNLDPGEEAAHPSAIAVPLGAPASAVSIAQPHNVIRLERVGGDLLLNGYRDLDGLILTYLDLGETARIASTRRLVNRFESEGRSHAFNSIANADGSGIIGVPTIERVEQASRAWWWSSVSDLSYLTFDSAGRLADAGFLKGRAEDEVETAPGYDCEVSCIDWYGNARPFFLGGKVFGLMATELVEAELVGGKVTERRRVDLTGPVVAR
jgi:hypothetical protein